MAVVKLINLFILDKFRKAIREVLKEGKELKETMKALENKNSDAEYFAIMYSMTRPSLASPQIKTEKSGLATRDWTRPTVSTTD